MGCKEEGLENKLTIPFFFQTTRHRSPFIVIYLIYCTMYILSMGNYLKIWNELISYGYNLRDYTGMVSLKVLYTQRLRFYLFFNIFSGRKSEYSWHFKRKKKKFLYFSKMSGKTKKIGKNRDFYKKITVDKYMKCSPYIYFNNCSYYNIFKCFEIFINIFNFRFFWFC